MVFSGQDVSPGGETPVTWKEWLEDKNVPGERLPSELQCRRYSLISRYPEVLAMFREAMKAVNQHDVPCNNVTGQTTGTSITM